MKIVPLLVWFWANQWNICWWLLTLARLQVSFRSFYLPNSQDVVLATGGHEFAVTAKFDDPYSTFIVLKLYSLLK